MLVSRRLNEPARSASSESSLRRSIGTFALAASIVNVTIGAGIFRLPADMAATLGPTAPVGYILCAIAMGLIVICIAEAGSRVSLTGSPPQPTGTHITPRIKANGCEKCAVVPAADGQSARIRGISASRGVVLRTVLA